MWHHLLRGHLAQAMMFGMTGLTDNAEIIDSMSFIRNRKFMHADFMMHSKPFYRRKINATPFTFATGAF